MSTTIDNKIVEMSFNNTDFEKNAQQSIETTEKLKKSLNFDGVGKGLEQISSAAKGCDLSVLTTAASAVGEKFDSMKVIAVLALQDIYNMATRTASQLVNLFAIEPVSSGFEEYELKMGAVQTIMASTNEDLSTVNAYLDELNTYADKTIYSFADMTNNIGKFTNAGVSLDKAVAAIQGISNEAAVSGANTNEASRAMYNFAQALSAGYVKLIDWKSIENANMATVEFKQQLINTAVELGNLEQQADGTYKVLTQSSTGSTMDDAISATQNFNDSLQYQWMTTDVLVETLNDYADETTAIGKKAFAAATEVKTFSMMMDTLTESAGSGWTETWEILVGDFNEAKVFWTDLTNYFDAIIGNMSTARNNLLQGSLASGFDLIEKKVEKAGINVDDFENKIKELGNASGVAVDDIINQAGSMGQAFADGSLSTDLITQAISELGASNKLTEKTIKSLNDSATNMFDNLEAKSGRTLLQESLFNVLNSIKTVIDSIASAWNRVEEGFTASKIYGVIQKINTATSNFKAYIDENLADPWLDVESAITDSGLSMDEFQSRLIEAGNQNGVDVQALIDQYGSLEECFANNAISTDLVTQAYENLANETTTTTQTVTKTIDDLSETLDYYQNVVDEVWNGDWKNAPERYQLLAEAGYDYQKVQALVNRTVDQHRLTLEDLNEVGIDTTETTEEEVEALNELAESARESGKSVNEALNKMGHKTGLQIAVEAVHDVFASLKTVVSSVVESFKNVFFDSSLFSKLADDAYSLVSYIQSQTKELSSYVTEHVENIKAVFTEVFDAIKTVAVSTYKSFRTVFSDTSVFDGIKNTLAGVISQAGTLISQLASYISSHGNEIEKTITGILKVIKSLGKNAGSIVSGLLKVFNKLFGEVSNALPDVLKLSAGMGDFFSELADGIDVSDKITEFFNWLSENLPSIPGLISDIIDKLKELLPIDDLLNNVKNALEPFTTFDTSINLSAPSTLADWIYSAIEAIQSGSIDLYGAISSMGQGICDAIASAVSYVKEHGIQSVLSALSSGGSGLKDAISSVGDGIGSAVSGVTDSVWSFLGDLGRAALTIVPIVGSFYMLNEMVKGLKQIEKIVSQYVVPIKQSINELLNTCTSFVSTLNKQATELGKALKTAIWSESLINIAIALGVIALAIAGFFAMASANPEALKTAMNDVCTILGLIIVLVIVAQKMDPTSAAVMQSASAIVLAVGVSIKLIASALSDIASIDSSNLTAARRTLEVVALILLVIVVVIMKIAAAHPTLETSSGVIKQIGNLLLKIGASFLLIALGMKIIGSMDDSAYQKAMYTITIVMLLMAGLCAESFLMSLSKVAGASDTFKNAGSAMVGIAASMLIIAGVIYILGNMDPAAALKGVVILSAVAVLLSGLMVVYAICSRISGGNSMGTLGLLGVAASLGIIAGIAILCGQVDPAQFQRGYECVTQLAVLVEKILLVTTIINKIGGSGSVGGAASLLALSVMIGILAALSIMMGLVDPETFWRGYGCVAALAAIAAGLAYACSFMKLDKGQSSMMTSLLQLAAVIAVLGVIAVAFTFIDQDKLYSAVGALSILMIVFGLMGVLLNSSQSMDKNGAVNIVIMVVAVAALSGLVYALTQVPNPQYVLPIAIGLSALMLALSVAMKNLQKLNDVKIDDSVVFTLGILAGAVAGLAIVIAVLSNLFGNGNIAMATTLAGSMCALIIALSAAMLVMSKMDRNSFSDSTQETLIKMAAIMGVLGIVVAVCCNLGGNGNIAMATTIALSMGIMINALASAMLILSLMKNATIDSSILVTLGILTAIMAILGALVTLLATTISVDQCIQVATISGAMSVMIVALAAAATILGGYQGTAAAGVEGVGVFTVLVTAIVALAALLGELDTILNGGLGDAVSAGMDILVTIAEKVGEAIGKFVGAIGVGLTEQLKTMATNVSTAMMILSIGSQAMNEDAVSKISMFSEALLKLGEAGLVDAIANLLGAGNIDLVGTLTMMGQGVSAFCTAIGGTDLSNAETGANAIKTLCEGLSSIPKEGGLLSGLLGDANYDKFASGAEELGKMLPKFVEAVGDVNTDSVQPSCDALGTLITTLSNLPDTGGWLQQLTGTKDYGKFAENLESLGKALPAYVTAVGDISTENVEPSCNALTKIIQTMSDLPDQGGWLANITGGKMDMESFINNLSGLGSGLKAYCDNLKDANLDTGYQGAVAIANIVNTLKSMQEANVDTSVVTKFKSAIDALKQVDLTGLNETYSAENTGIFSNLGSSIFDQLKQSIESIDFTSLGTTLSSKLSEGISTALSGASATTDTSFVSAIAQSLYNADSVQQFTTVGVNLANMFKNGLQQGFTSSDGSGISIDSIISSLTSAIDGQSQAMITAGTNLGNWFKNGFTQAFNSVDSLDTSIGALVSNLGGHYQDFYTAGTNMANAFRDGFDATIGTLNVPINTVVSQVDSASGEFSTSGASAMSNYADGMSANTGLAATQASYASSNAASTASNGSGSFYAPGVSAMISYASGMASGGNYATAAMTVIDAAVYIKAMSASGTYMSAGTALVNSFAGGLSAGSNTAHAAASVVVAAACAAIAVGNAVFYTAGYNAALGFANGISSGSFAAVIAATAMATAASNAAKSALNEHSPSRVFFGIGDYAAQGLALGMEDRTNMVERAGANIATSAIAGYNSVAGGSLFDMNTSIIPSIDYAAISSNTGKLDFSATMNRLIADPVKTSADRMAETQARFEASNQKIVDGLSAVQNDLSAYTTAVANSETAMYVDGNKLASSIVKPMNKQLGILSKRNR